MCGVSEQESPPGQDLDEQVRAWRAADPDPETRAAIDAALADGDAGRAKLRAWFAEPLHFGTAGVRAARGPGPSRLNRLTARQIGRGAASLLRDDARVVIGRDARVGGAGFQAELESAMLERGASVERFAMPVPTPVVAHRVRDGRLDAGIVCTASHNPSTDSGVKLYGATGAQLDPAEEASVEAAIGVIDPLAAPAPHPSGGGVAVDAEARHRYLDDVVGPLADGIDGDLSLVYTALHGVGADLVDAAFERVGLAPPSMVASQRDPDGTFPTVPYPNPEEPGALDAAVDLASQRNADAVLANDPDADRLAVAAPLGPAGAWRMLTGDEVGALLGWWIAQRRAAGQEPVGTMAESIVSGTLLARIAEDAGYDFATTLTGFKWIARAPDLVFGYEEALGYCVDPAAVADKDGITASLLFLELAAHLAAQGRDVQDALDDLARRFGLYLTGPLAVRVADVGLIEKMMDRLRDDPPSELGGRPILRIEDLARGGDGLPPTDGLRFTMADARVIIRPSGTEPKLKCYLQVVVPAGEDLSAAKAAGQAELATVRASVAAALGVG